MIIRLFFLALVFFPVFAEAKDVGFTPSLSLYGDIKYPANFQHFDYVNPEAPIGGRLRLAVVGTFDSFNPYILKGDAAAGTDLVTETLMFQSKDEPFTLYGLLADGVRVAPDKSFVEFHINPAAKFSDGMPVTADDVAWTFQTLIAKGHPSFRAYYADVTKAAANNEKNIVRFDFKNKTNRELPLILAQLPVLAKHFYEDVKSKHDFSKTTLEAPLGSGPYRVKTSTPGRTVVYERVKDWWGRDLPVNRGRYNFNEISYDYFRDATVALQALFSGAYDVREENIAKEWATSYDNKKPVRDKLIVKQSIEHELPTGMQGFVFNIRKPQFQDRRVREALTYAFDFDWSNKNVAYGSYTRTQSYFSNSDLAATGLPSADEVKLLQPFKDQLPPDVFTTEFHAPKNDGSGLNRANLKHASDLLKEAGYQLENGVMTKDGKALTFEILEVNPAFERWIQPYLRNLEKIGVHATLRLVDTAQMQRLQDDFSYDMIVSVFGQSSSPGNEQRDYWGSAKADIRGSRNLIGIKNPVIDALVEKIVHADTRAELLTACHALDRILLWNYYVVPHWHIKSYRLAYWDKFGMPAVTPKYALPIVDTWWIDPVKQKNIDSKTETKN